MKLIDVYSGDHPGKGPESGVAMGGYQQLVRGEPFRGKFRNSFEHPTPFVPGEESTVSFTVPDVRLQSAATTLRLVRPSLDRLSSDHLVVVLGRSSTPSERDTS